MTTSASRKAEEIRLRYLYRNLVLRQKIRLPLEAAVKLVGPDCAYHLYAGMNNKGRNDRMREDAELVREQKTTMGKSQRKDA